MWTFPSITSSQLWKEMRSRTPGDDGSSRLCLERSSSVGLHSRPLSSAMADFAPGRLAAAASRAPQRFPSHRRLHTATRRPCSPPLPCVAAVLSCRIPVLCGAPSSSCRNTPQPCDSIGRRLPTASDRHFHLQVGSARLCFDLSTLRQTCGCRCRLQVASL